MVEAQATNWRSGLCDCCSTPGCCLACWCPCCVFGQIAAKMSSKELCCGGDYCSSCTLYYFVSIFPPHSLILVPAFLSNYTPMPASYCVPFGALVHCPMRSAIRKKYDIPGNNCEDCMVVWCCACCALVQVLLPNMRCLQNLMLISSLRVQKKTSINQMMYRT